MPRMGQMASYLLLLSVLLLCGCPQQAQRGRVIPPASAGGTTSSIAPEAGVADATAQPQPDPLASPPQGINTPPETPGATGSVVAGAGQVHHLPADLKVAEYSGMGVDVDIYAVGATPRAGRGDPAEISFVMVVQRAVGDFTVLRWKSGVPKPTMQSVKTGPCLLEVTPRCMPQSLGPETLTHKIPLVHKGWYDLVLKDFKGHPLGRMSISDEGWPTFAPEQLQPDGALATTVREGGQGATHFDFVRRDNDAPLLRVETFEGGGCDEFEADSQDGEQHELSYPHAALRFLAPDQFMTTAQTRAQRHKAEADDSPRDPDKEHPITPLR